MQLITEAITDERWRTKYATNEEDRFEA